MHAKQACPSVRPHDGELRARQKANKEGKSIFHQPGVHSISSLLMSGGLLSVVQVPCRTWPWVISDSNGQHRASGAKVSYLEAPACLKGRAELGRKGSPNQEKHRLTPPSLPFCFPPSTLSLSSLLLFPPSLFSFLHLIISIHPSIQFKVP